MEKTVKKREKKTEETPVDFGRIERLKLIIRYLRMTQLAFAESIGINERQVSHWMTGYRGISEKTIKKIISIHKQFKMEWLMHGNGYMLASGEPAVFPEGMDVAPLSVDELRNLVLRLTDRVHDLTERLEALEKKG